MFTRGSERGGGKGVRSQLGKCGVSRGSNTINPPSSCHTVRKVLADFALFD